jgi:thioredoxin 2
MSDHIFVSCPHCHRKNRLPAGKLAHNGTCGACKQALFTGQPMLADHNNFDYHLHADLPIVVDFWAPWCGPCRQFAPTFEAAATSLEPRVRLLKVNTEQEQALAQRFGIRSIPTIVAFKNGRELARISGALPAAQFSRWVLEHI